MRIVLALMLVVLAGCTREVNLRSPDGSHIGRAQLEFADHHAGMVVLRMGDVEYAGSFTEQKVDEGRQIADSYGMNSRKYREYRQGRGNYLWRGKASLQAENGDQMQCEFSYRGTIGQGTCISATDAFDFVGEG